MAVITGVPLHGLVVAACACSMMLYGYDQGVLSGLVDIEPFLSNFGYPSSTVIGLIVAIYDIGCALGALSTIFIGDRLGRKKTILVGGVLICIGSAIQASSYSIPQMIVGRIVTGLGNGINSNTVPIFQAEMAPSHLRGTLVMGQIAILIFGLVISNWANYGFVFGGTVTGSAQWRTPVALQAIFPIMGFFLIPFIPESPRWLAREGREFDVRRVISLLRGKGATPDDESVAEEAAVIMKTVQHEEAMESSWTDMFKQGEHQNLRRMLLGVSFQFFQQFTGVCAMTYYTPHILTGTLGMSPRLALIVSGCGSICFLLGCIVSSIIIERQGRRNNALWGLVTCALSMIGLGASTAVAQLVPARSSQGGYAALAFVMSYYLCYGCSWNGLPWLYTPELQSLRMRNRATAIATATEWTCMFVIVLIVPVAVENIGWRIYLIFVVVTSVGVVFAYFTYPETKDCTLEEMDRYFLLVRSWNVRKTYSVRKTLDALDTEGEVSGKVSGSEYEDRVVTKED